MKWGEYIESLLKPANMVLLGLYAKFEKPETLAKLPVPNIETAVDEFKEIMQKEIHESDPEDVETVQLIMNQVLQNRGTRLSKQILDKFEAETDNFLQAQSSPKLNNTELTAQQPDLPAVTQPELKVSPEVAQLKAQKEALIADIYEWNNAQKAFDLIGDGPNQHPLLIKINEKIRIAEAKQNEPTPAPTQPAPAQAATPLTNNVAQAFQARGIPIPTPRATPEVSSPKEVTDRKDSAAPQPSVHEPKQAESASENQAQQIYREQRGRRHAITSEAEAQNYHKSSPTRRSH